MAAAKPTEDSPVVSKYKVLRGKVTQDGKSYQKGDIVEMDDAKAARTQDGMLQKVR